MTPRLCPTCGADAMHVTAADGSTVILDSAARCWQTEYDPDAPRGHRVFWVFASKGEARVEHAAVCRGTIALDPLLTLRA